MNEGVRI